MPTPYTGRHRAATAGARHDQARHKPTRSLFHPLSVSAVSLGVTLAVVHTATSVGDITRANAAAPVAAVNHLAAPDDVASPEGGPAAPPSVVVPVPPQSVPALSDAVSRALERGPRAKITPPAPPPPPKVDTTKLWVMPVAGAKLSSTYGMRWGAMHRGIDLAGPAGLPLKAMTSGVVTLAGQQDGYGNIVQIKYWDGTVSYFGHMNSIAVTKGQTVTPGQVVGQLGSSGQSTGPHLHLEIHPAGAADVDPLPWLSRAGLTIG